MEIRIERAWRVFSLLFCTIVVIVLIIRIATTPFFGGSYPVDLHFSRTASLVDGDERDLTVTIPVDKPALIGRVYTPEEDLERTFKELYEFSSDRRILLRVDKTVRMGKFRRVVRAASTAGFQKIIVVTFEGSAFDLLIRQRAA